jgi:general secretion pathway protein E/type IV pilus assembly protein PilB
MRILDEKQSILTMEKLGFSEQGIALVKKMIMRPEGVVILTGPTGSGKTTTLYTLLNYINSIDKNIMTLEDPVEYHIPLIRQSNIRADIGIDFATGIRTLLRQDPDVILVGEIRDKDTAITAIQAAMTGHQVYSSLHTNDALGAIPRLMNMGVPNYLMAGSIICVLAQRLARKLCPHGKKEGAVTELDKKLLGTQGEHVESLFRATGCDKCNNTGYKGRVVISEVLPFDKELDELVASGASKKEMMSYVSTRGFVTMVEDGITKVITGVTDFKELMRVVDMTERM